MNHRRWFIILALLAVSFAIFLALSSPPGVAAQEPPPGVTVDQAVTQAIDTQGQADFVIVMADQADLSPAYAMTDWNERGRFVYNTLKATAAESQADVLATLKRSGLRFRSFIASNEIYVYQGTRNTLELITDLPGVESVHAPVEAHIDTGGLETWNNYSAIDPQETTQAVTDWGLTATHATDFWSTFSDTGENIRVANIDTGVQYNHPALANAYQCAGANPGDPSCWYDPTNVCPAGTPCDNNGHGTHTMGTMVGSNSSSLAYNVGMAPGATWIACKGCADTNCANDTLQACAEWILAPGGDPDNRPQIVNNSWGGAGGEDWFLATVKAWRAAGIFPAFSAGNEGTCSSVGSPSDYQESFSAGSYSSDGAISAFSSKGPGGFGDDPYVKPNLVAPGSFINSSLPTNTWGYESGTSMASPHVAGAVALLWSCAPYLKGNIDETFQILQQSADPAPDGGSCGAPAAGTSGNYTFGNGYLNVLAAGQLMCNTGEITGVVTDSGSHHPLAGASVSAQQGGSTFVSTKTASDGSYSLVVANGTFSVVVSKYGYYDELVDNVEVLTNESTTVNVAVGPKATVQISGHVLDGSGRGVPLPATITYQSGGVVVQDTTDFQGAYSTGLYVETTYQVKVAAKYSDYLLNEESLTTGGTASTHDYALQVNPETCGALGYIRMGGVSQTFEQSSLPALWSNVDYLGNQQVWTFTSPNSGISFANSSGGFAQVDSDAYQYENSQDTALITPTMDLYDATSVHLSFDTEYRYYFNNPDNQIAKADVDISLDNGKTWTNVWEKFKGTNPYEGTVSLNLSSLAAGKSSVRLRFHYYHATYDYWWRVDNVTVTPGAYCVLASDWLFLPEVKR